jgi:hypothetical protein
MKLAIDTFLKNHRKVFAKKYTDKYCYFSVLLKSINWFWLGFRGKLEIGGSSKYYGFKNGMEDQSLEIHH